MLKTAECVTPKHPDKICDQISDAILDYCLKIDPNSRVAIETMGGHGKIYITGELTMNCNIDYIEFANLAHKITGKDEEVFLNVIKQSPEIANGVDTGGAGDQGIMVGYACNDNVSMIPRELDLARSLAKHIYKTFEEDGKTQVTIDDLNQVKSLVVSFCNVRKETLFEEIKEWCEAMGINIKYIDLHINPAGDWNQGGFDADTGLTGRKLAVDNYGPQIPIGGGAFSGKDATKVDRSGAYMARKIAVDLLKFYGANQVIVKLAYSIGLAEPVMATALVDGRETSIPSEMYDLTPKGIIKFLGLDKPIFQETAEWGHFGNGFNWDK